MAGVNFCGAWEAAWAELPSLNFFPKTVSSLKPHNQPEGHRHRAVFPGLDA